MGKNQYISMRFTFFNVKYLYVTSNLYRKIVDVLDYINSRKNSCNAEFGFQKQCFPLVYGDKQITFLGIKTINIQITNYVIYSTSSTLVLFPSKII